MTVNVIGRQLEDARFASDLRHVLAASGALPSQLAPELTESSIGGPSAAAALRQVREAGVLLFIDDFRVGYSNLTRLQHLPFDVVKIDRAFIAELGCSGGSTAMVRAIVAMAAELGLEVIADGIEYEDQARALRALGVDIGQGYHYGRPAPAPTRRSEPTPAIVAPV